MIVSLMFIPLAASAAQRTFVSAETGSDSNACSRTSPCRNFNAAMLLTDTGGEVVVLDSGGYGTASITQAVALVATGVQAAITAFSGNANLNHVAISDNSGHGLSIGNNVNAVVNDTISENNGNFGYSCSGAATQLTLTNSIAAHQTGFNTGGLIASGGCTARLANCTIVDNYNGLQNYATGATILSRVDNTLEGGTNQVVGNVGQYLNK